MKKYTWCINWCIFIVLFLFLFQRVSYVLRPLEPGNNLSIVGFYGNKDELDIVNVGSSSVTVYWSPLQAWNEHGFTSYNFSSNALASETVLPMIKEVLKYQLPELFIIDLRRFTVELAQRSEMNVRNLTDNMNYSLDRLKFIMDIVPNKMEDDIDDNIYNYIFDIAKYHENWKTLSDEQLESSRNKTYDKAKGFMTYSRISYNLSNFEDFSDHTKISKPSDYNDKLFEELLEYISDIDTQFLFLVSPYSESEEEREWYNYYEQRILENGHKYFNTNNHREEMDLIDVRSNYYDKFHLNVIGSEKYTTYLGNFLVENYDLPDRREDENFSHWNSEYEEFVVTIESLKEEVYEILSR